MEDFVTFIAENRYFQAAAIIAAIGAIANGTYSTVKFFYRLGKDTLIVGFRRAIRRMVFGIIRRAIISSSDTVLFIADIFYHVVFGAIFVLFLAVYIGLLVDLFGDLNAFLQLPISFQEPIIVLIVSIRSLLVIVTCGMLIFISWKIFGAIGKLLILIEFVRNIRIRIWRRGRRLVR